MTNAEKLLVLCSNGMKQRGLLDQAYKERLMKEIKEITNLSEADYFIDLHKKGMRFPYNENNLIVPFVLGIVDDFKMEIPSIYIQGEFPDIDVDFLPSVRKHLKNDWAKKEFGEANVCAIGNYTTY